MFSFQHNTIILATSCFEEFQMKANMIQFRGFSSRLQIDLDALAMKTNLYSREFLSKIFCFVM